MSINLLNLKTMKTIFYFSSNRSNNCSFTILSRCVLLMIFLIISLNCMSQNTKDTLSVSKIGKINCILMNGKELENKEVLNLMNNHPAAYRYMKRANTYQHVCSKYFLVGGAIIGLGGMAVFNKSIVGICVFGGGGLALELIGVCMSCRYIGYKKNARTAVRLYNNEILSKKATTGCNFKVGFGQNGLGLAISF